ncbi:MAG TPA: cupin [Acidimicrobiales bacterium]|nr:cupin [Acidimicrobiales bacterium]
MSKPHLEFHRLDLESGWEVPAGYPSGIRQKVLASDLDEEAGTGSRTRLLRFDPGAFTTTPFVHDHWEEVYLLSGDLIVGDETFEGATWACRPPGAPHGPFRSRGGCLLLESHYYACD